jgi:hypothetical protein
MRETIFVNDPRFPDWKELHCGVCWKKLMGHTLGELRHCAFKSGRRFGETEDYLLPAHLSVHVGPAEGLTEIQKHFYEGTCPSCGKRTSNHTLDQFKECLAKASLSEGS